jgi:ferredoxin-NADP reductase
LPEENLTDHLKLRVKQIIRETESVKSFILLPDKPIKYKAGQFITLIFKTAQGEERRSYSFSSSPDTDNTISITVKRVENGKYSRPLFEILKEGDEIMATAPAGLFVLPESIDYYRQIVFFAAGIGITPVFSLIKSALIKYPNVELILVYSNSTHQSTVFYQQLLDLQKLHPERLKLEFLFSSSQNLTRARLSKWLLPQLLEVYKTKEDHKTLFYTCGPKDYMRMVTIAIEEEGFSKDEVRKENFDTTPVIKKESPPDLQTHQVVLRIGDRQYQIETTYPQSILEAAKKSNINIPYSCETGKCGSCVMNCVIGKVWMSYNEVLTANDIASGKVLTCTGFPAGGDIELQL